MIGMLLWLAATGRAQTGSPTEYEIKAAMLYRFAQFLDWPGNDAENATVPLIFGIVGQDPFGGSIDALLKNQKVGERSIIIQRYPQSGISPTNCHLIFVSRSVADDTVRLLTELKTFPALTVGESEDFTRNGGHIRLYLQDNKLRFEVNMAALERSGLKMHSQVLKLATRVTRDGKDVKK